MSNLRDKYTSDEWNILEASLIGDKKVFERLPVDDEQVEPKHYDNSKGSIYKFAEEQKLNNYEFDIIKRIVRSRKKGSFREDLEKTKFLIDLYLTEWKNN